MNLLNELINDEKKIDRNLYSSGVYWEYKNKRTVSEIKKKGLNDFRGVTTGIGTSFTDNLILDVRNEFNIKGRIIGKILSFPPFKVIFDEQLRITKNHMNSDISNREIVFSNDQNVIELIDKFKFENTTDFGCVSKFKYLDKEYSCHYMEMAHRVNNLSKLFDFNKIQSYFEIGGGFGSNIHFLITNFPNIRKVLYLDAVPNIYVGTQYLKHHYKEKVKDYTQFKDLDKITFSNNNELEILCIPPWLIEKMDVKIDHFHNAVSFVEMPKHVIQNYSKYIKKFETKQISLISYDAFDLKTTFKPEELNIFFDNKLNISWKKTLIEKHNRKFIYLTSN